MSPWWLHFVGVGLLHLEAGVAIGCDLVALLAVGADAAGVRQHAARLARHVGSRIPRVGFRDQGGVGGLVVVRNPTVLRFPSRLDDLLVPAAHEADAVADP